MDSPTKPAKRTMNLTIEDIKEILMLATANRYPVGEEGYDWDAVEFMYQNTIPENYIIIVQKYPEIAKTKWGKEIEVAFSSGKTEKLSLIIRADGYVCLQNWSGITFPHSNALPIAKKLMECGFPVINRMGDANAQRLC